MSSTPSSASGATKDRDRHIVERVLGGDAENYRMLIDRYQVLAAQFAFAMTDSDVLAQRCVDDGFAMAFHAIVRIPHPGNFFPFVLRAIRRRLLEELPRLGAPAPLDPTLAMHFVEAQATNQVNATTGRAIRAMLLLLPYEQREAWALKHVAQVDDEDGAHVAGVSVSAYTSRAALAKVTLEQMARAARAPIVAQTQATATAFVPVVASADTPSKPGPEDA